MTDRPRDRRPIALAALSALTLAALAAAPLRAEEAAKTPLATELRQVAATTGADHYAVAACVRDAADGRALFEFKTDGPLVPASNQKLITTAAALAALGPHWQFHTLVGTMGDDLVIVGGGDPNFSVRYWNGDAMAAFRQWASALKSRGITHITGDLVFDDSAFDDQFVHPDWMAEDLPHHYAAPVGALMAAESCVTITVTAARTAGRPASVSLSPAGDLFALDGAIKTVASKRNTYRADLRPGGQDNVLRLSGQVPARSGAQRVRRAVIDPGTFAAAAILETLRDEGIRVDGRAVRRRVRTDTWRLPEAFKAHVIHTSTLEQTLRVANVESDNLYAESLMKAVGAYAGGDDPRWPSRQGSWAEGSRQIASALAGLGIDAAGSHFADGSGLAPTNRTTADLLSQLLVAMSRREDAELWMSTLGRWGDGVGLERKYGSDERLTGRVWAKTGYLKTARALSGYVRTESGRLLAFSMLANLPYSTKAHRAAKAWHRETLLVLVGQ